MVLRKRDTIFFTAVNLLNYLDRYLVSAVLPLLIAEMQLSNEEGGRLVSAFVLGYFVFSPVFGWLGDRYNRPRLMAFGVFLWSLATIATGLTHSFLLFVTARIFVGIGEASFGTIAPGYLKDRIPDPVRLNFALSVFFAAIPVGSALGYVLGGVIAKHYSWNAVFFCGGVPGVLLALWILRYPEVRTRNVTELNLKEGFQQIARIPLLWFAIFGYVLNSFALNGAAAFIASYGVSLGFALDAINTYFGLILVVAGLIGTLGGGKLSSRFAEGSPQPARRMLLFVGASALVGVPFLFAAFNVEHHGLFLALLFIGELCIFAGTGPVNAVIVSVCPPAYVTLTQGVTIFLLNLVGALLAPVTVGAVADVTSLRTGMLLTSVAMLAAALIWIWGGLAARSATKTVLE